MMLTAMGKTWGGSLRRTVVIDDGAGCMVSSFLTLFTRRIDADCQVAIEENSLMAKREFYEGRLIAGVGVGLVSLKSNTTIVGDNDVVGIPLELTWRTKKWRTFGVGLSLLGNINEENGFVAFNVNMELGKRY